MLVYLLIVVNFQSWLDPFIIITALPAALAGIVWMLFLTHTTVSVPALTGAIMCMGVATANSVLVVSFARERMDAGDDAAHAASQAGFTRFRPVLMTALAMIIGMVPMALGLGEGGEQNAPLGRAVIGGLIFATVATLFFVPTVFAIIHGRARRAGTLHNPPEQPMTDTRTEPRERRLSAHRALRLDRARRRPRPGRLGNRQPRACALDARQGDEHRGDSAGDDAEARAAARPREELVLPGNVQAFIEAPIYARTNGYLKSWYTDIGTPVKKGQLLAEIDTPEVDQQSHQAQADLATAQANSQLAITTDERWQGLLATHSVSQQDADTKAADAAAKKAAEASAAANVARLRDLESFKRVVAPFDGVVTQRNTDIGALINAGQNAGAALFRVADTSKLRIYVLVPEPYAVGDRTGHRGGAALHRASGPELSGDGGAHRERHRSHPAHAAGGAAGRQRERRALPRRLRRGAFQDARQQPDPAPAGEYAAVPRGRPAGRDRRWEQPRASEEHRARARLRQDRSRCSPASTRTTTWW